MRILLLSQYFPPEVGATQTRVVTFARHLSSAGHDVTVIAELPNHPIGRIFPGWGGRPYRRAAEDGLDVVRVWVHASPRKSFWRRISFYASYAVTALLAALFVVRRRPQVIIASSPPLPVLVVAWVLGVLWRRPYVADIRDIWPAVGVALGEVSPGRALDVATKLEHRLYRDAAEVVCVTHGFVEHIVAAGIARARVHLVSNGTIPEIFDPERRDPEMRDRLGLDDHFVVGYVGLHGIAQGLGVLLDAAALLPEEDVSFLFVGEGPTKEALQQDAASRGLANVVFHSQVPLADVAPYINVCDVVVVPLRRLEVLETFVPSKLFDLMCCARPVLLMVDGEARQLLEAADGGVYVPAEDGPALADAIRALMKDPARREEMGRNGRAHVLAHYVRDRQAAALEQIVVSAASGSAR